MCIGLSMRSFGSPECTDPRIMVPLDKVPFSKSNRWEISVSSAAENPGLKPQACRGYSKSSEKVRNVEHFNLVALRGRKMGKKERAWNNSAMGRRFALHAANLVLNPSISYIPLSMARSDS